MMAGMERHPQTSRGERTHEAVVEYLPLFTPAASAHLVVQPFLPLPLFCDSPPLSLNWDRT
ncbi:MAG: hypothetical protein OXC57_13455, partial [Rhodobacteraceae bacterium]|nr:hypothetical protein [Paracoccaceae bacterium]